jgi:hypothetical protein
MDIAEINNALLLGKYDAKGVLPHLEALAISPFRFEVDFGLEILPNESGLLLIRGARQYGKSTWLEDKIAATM